MKKLNKDDCPVRILFLVLSIVHINQSYCMSNQSMQVPQVDIHDVGSMNNITMPIELNMRAFTAALQLDDNGPGENENVDEWCQKWVKGVFNQIDAYSPHDDKRKQCEERALQRIKEKILTRRSQKYNVLSKDSSLLEPSKRIWRHKAIIVMSVGIVIMTGIAYGIWKYKNRKSEIV